MKYVFENGGITWWKGHCPLCAIRNKLYSMRRNRSGNFVCSCGIQIYVDESTNSAVILNTEGQRKYINLSYDTESEFYLRSNNLTLILCPQTEENEPYHQNNNRFTMVKELERYVWDTVKKFR